eukprot:TRINITY_DN6868_c0_g1_i2.p2 TRINITY_DN6868_c0_g1~~TRINITY_DN6868_c0_g1_i2.p2  ORF type:complete len:159 (+),score=29.56 TRINITY_DN6868_c0_g1_i2:255-731(+)
MVSGYKRVLRLRVLMYISLWGTFGILATVLPSRHLFTNFFAPTATIPSWAAPTISLASRILLYPHFATLLCFSKHHFIKVLTVAIAILLWLPLHIVAVNTRSAITSNLSACAYGLALALAFGYKESVLLRSPEYLDLHAIEDLNTHEAHDIVSDADAE